MLSFHSGALHNYFDKNCRCLQEIPTRCGLGRESRESCRFRLTISLTVFFLLKGNSTNDPQVEIQVQFLIADIQTETLNL